MNDFRRHLLETGMALAVAMAVATPAALWVWGALKPADALQISNAFITVVVIVWTVRTWVARSSSEIEETINRLTKTVQKAIEPQEERLGGITRAYSTSTEALDDFFAHLERSSRRAALMQLSPYLILTRNRRELMTVLERGTELRIMMLDPESPFIELLTSRLGSEHLKDELHAGVESCLALGMKYPNFQFRLYREPQPFNILLLDDVAMLTPRLPLRTHRGLALRVERGPVLSSLEDVFETVWMSAAVKTNLQRAVL